MTCLVSLRLPRRLTGSPTSDRETYLYPPGAHPRHNSDGETEGAVAQWGFREGRAAIVELAARQPTVECT